MIIGFTGLKQSGKTTAANYLRDSYGFEVFSFADPLRWAAREIFMMTEDQFRNPELKEKIDPRWGITPRQALQQLGTEVVRQFDETVWVKNMQYRTSGADLVVIDDCRFPNETQWVKDNGGIVVGIQRPPHNVDLHSSEVAMFFNWGSMVDVTISNSDSLESLYAMIEYTIPRRPVYDRSSRPRAKL